LYIQDKNFTGALLQAKALDRRASENGKRIYSLGELSLANKEYSVAEQAFNYVISYGDENPYYLNARMKLVEVLKAKVTSDLNYTAEDLEKLRKLAPVSTICMHGSPLSKHDSKDLWKHFNYHDFGIIGEPYFDVDFKKVFYLTDTGRKWDGDKVSVRDRVDSGFDLSFHSTDKIIAAAKAHQLPHQIMFTFHPQRWNDDKIKWSKELLMQNAKNLIKRLIVKRR
jgi:hypothetical protein